MAIDCVHIKESLSEKREEKYIHKLNTIQHADQPTKPTEYYSPINTTLLEQPTHQPNHQPNHQPTHQPNDQPS